MDPDNVQHFNLNLPSAVDKVYQRKRFISEKASGKYLMLFKFNVYP